MKKFHEIVSFIRKDLMLSSSKAFYEYLSRGKVIGFNYSYLRKVESGDTLPSHKFVESLVSALPQKYTDMLVKSFCQNLFPKQYYLFDFEEGSLEVEVIEEEPVKSTLSLSQLATLCKSREHYFLFLIITLARRAISVKEISKYNIKKINTVIKDLEVANIIIFKENELKALASEQLFPTNIDARSNEKLDQWDKEISEFFDFKKINSKMFFRRISPRYLSLIETHLNTLFETIKLSDESNIKYNTEVINFNLSLTTGKVPG